MPPPSPSSAALPAKETERSKRGTKLQSSPDRSTFPAPLPIETLLVGLNKRVVRHTQQGFLAAQVASILSLSLFPKRNVERRPKSFQVSNLCSEQPTHRSSITRRASPEKNNVQGSNRKTHPSSHPREGQAALFCRDLPLPSGHDLGVHQNRFVEPVFLIALYGSRGVSAGRIGSE